MPTEEFLRAYRPLNLTRLPTSGGGKEVAISVDLMKADHVSCWMENVQPVIDASEEVRADKGWKWKRLLGVQRSAAGALRQDPAAFTICLHQWRCGKHRFVPCAMVLMVRRYVAFDSSPGPAAYVWYLSTAPKDALRPHIDDACIPKALGQAALDVAVTESFRAGCSGRIGLHAAAEGGEDLFNWYVHERKMQILPREHPMPTVARVNDGRYLYFTAQTAYHASRSLDSFRSPL